MTHSTDVQYSSSVRRASCGKKKDNSPKGERKKEGGGGGACYVSEEEEEEIINPVFIHSVLLFISSSKNFVSLCGATVSQF